MPRFYQRRLRAEAAALTGNSDSRGSPAVAVLERAPSVTAITEMVNGDASDLARGEPLFQPAAGPDVEPATKRRRAARPRAATTEEIAIEAIMTDDVAVVTGVLPADHRTAGNVEGAIVAPPDGHVAPDDPLDGDPADDDAAWDEIDGEIGAVDAPVDAVGMPAVRRRRRRGRRGAGRRDSETTAAEDGGTLPGEPALPPSTVEFNEGYVPDVPPSAHLNEMFRTGGITFPDPRRGRRRGGYGAGRERDATVTPEPDDIAEAEVEPVVRAPEPGARGGRQRLSPMEELIARQNVIFDQLVQKQTAMLKAMERVMTALERRGGGASGGGDGGISVAQQRVAVFVDVPNIVYAADRINKQVDWGKVLHYLTRDRQLVRATAYAPVSDDPYQRTEAQRFVQPFYSLPYRVLTKPMKRFGNGEIKANFDVELAIDVVTMADRLDVVCLVSGDGDFRRMVEQVQAKGVRVEVVAFSNSTAGELRAVSDEFIDFNAHLDEFCVTR